MKRQNKYAALAAIAISMASCSKTGWSVDGTVNGATEGTRIAVEGFNAGIWYNIDSIDVTSNGSFKFSSTEPSPYPDVYRISIDGKSIYFPIDSIDKVTITADASDFDKDYTLAGSSTAVEMMNVDKLIADAVKAKGAQAVLTDSLLKRELGKIVNDDNSGVLGYYIINKTIGDQPIFSIDNKNDLRIIGALANKFLMNLPDDPRTKYLQERYLAARAQHSTLPALQIEATLTGFFDIELYDPKGTKRKLSEIIQPGKVTLLSFTSYQIEPSVPYNVILNQLHEQGVNVYQVAVDEDEVEWRQSALNLPWTAVHYDNADNGALLGKYNVATIPTTFIIDANGDIVERVENPADLEKAVKKYK